MNSKLAKKLRKAAKQMATGVLVGREDKIYKQLKSVNKSVNGKKCKN